MFNVQWQRNNVNVISMFYRYKISFKWFSFCSHLSSILLCKHLGRLPVIFLPNSSIHVNIYVGRFWCLCVCLSPKRQDYFICSFFSSFPSNDRKWVMNTRKPYIQFQFECYGRRRSMKSMQRKICRTELAPLDSLIRLDRHWWFESTTTMTLYECVCA